MLSRRPGSAKPTRALAAPHPGRDPHTGPLGAAHVTTHAQRQTSDLVNCQAGAGSGYVWGVGKAMASL